MVKRRRIVVTKQLCICIGLGQLLALANAASGVFTTYLTTPPLFVSIPLFQSLLMYSAFCTLWVVPHVHRFFVHRRRDVLIFLAVGCIDVAANTLAVAAYSHTSVAAVSLLLNLSTPMALLFGVCIRRATYSWQQVVTAVLATLCAVAFTYVDTLGQSAGENAIGDVMALVSAACYGAESILNEYITVDYTNIQWLARMCVSALTIAMILFFALEFDAVVAGAVLESGMVWAYLVGFFLSLAVFYSTSPYVIGHSNAIVFNVSLIPGNIYSIIASALLFHQLPNNWIILPSILIIVLMVLYFVSPSSQYCFSIKPRTRVRTQAAEEAEARDVRTGAGADTGVSVTPAAEVSEVLK